MRQLASAMEHVHALGYIHRDLKPANILLHEDTLKLADFGLACRRPEGPTALTAETGSYRYMAPEVMRHEPYDESCDVYSFSLVCWSLFSGVLPFPDCSPVEAAFGVADRGARPPMPPACPTGVRELIQRCWRQRLEDRPSFEVVVRELEVLHPFRPSGDGAPATSADCVATSEASTVVPSAEVSRAEGEAYPVKDEKQRLGVSLNSLDTGALLFSFELEPATPLASSASSSGPREAFGEDAASPKSERKRVVLDPDQGATPSKHSRSPPTIPEDGPSPQSSMHRELSISTGLETLLKVKVAPQRPAD